MPRVQIPDYNTFVDFPDDMQQDEMAAVIEEKFPKREATLPQGRWPFTKDAGVLGDITVGLGQAGGNVVGTVQRALGYEDAADKTFRNVTEAERLAAEARPGLVPSVTRGVASGAPIVGATLGASVASGGSVPIIAAAGAGLSMLQRGMGSITEAKDARTKDGAPLPADTQRNFVLSQIGIEGILGGVLGVTGAKAAAAPVAAGMKAALKEMGKRGIVNIGAAESGLLMDHVARSLTGVNPSEITASKVAQAALVAAAQQGPFEIPGIARAIASGRKPNLPPKPAGWKEADWENAWVAASERAAAQRAAQRAQEKFDAEPYPGPPADYNAQQMEAFNRAQGPQFRDLTLGRESLAENPIGDITSQNPTTPRIAPRQGMPETGAPLTYQQRGELSRRLPDVERMTNAPTSGPELPTGVVPLESQPIRGDRAAFSPIPEIPSRPGLPGVDPMRGGPEPPRLGPDGSPVFTPGPNAPELAGLGGGPVRPPQPPRSTGDQGQSPFVHDIEIDPYAGYGVDWRASGVGVPLRGSEPAMQPLGGIGNQDSRRIPYQGSGSHGGAGPVVDISQQMAPWGSIPRTPEVTFTPDGVSAPASLQGLGGGPIRGPLPPRTSMDEGAGPVGGVSIDQYAGYRGNPKALEDLLGPSTPAQAASKLKRDYDALTPEQQDAWATQLLSGQQRPAPERAATPAKPRTPDTLPELPEGATIPIRGAEGEKTAPVTARPEQLAKWTTIRAGLHRTEVAGNTYEITKGPDGRWDILRNEKVLMDGYGTLPEAKKDISTRIEQDVAMSEGFFDNPERGAANLGALFALPKAAVNRAITSMHGGYTPEQWSAHIAAPNRARYIETEVGRSLMALNREIPKTPAVKPSVVYEAMTGNAAAKRAVDATPLAEPVRRLRDHIDTYSKYLADVMEPHNPRGADSIRANEGTWLRRSYRMFDYADGKLGDWLKEAKKSPLWSTAAQEVGGEKALTDLLQDIHQDGVDNIAFGAGKSKIPWQSMHKRKDISPALRSVMGEITDPVEAAGKSIVTLGSMIARAEMQNKMVNTLKGQMFDDRASAPFGYKQISDAPGYGPLAGKYVSPEFHDAFTAMNTETRGGVASAIYNGFLGYTKAAKTIGNVPVGAMKQIPANIMMTVGNGDFGALPGINLFTQGKRPFMEYYKSRFDGTRFAKDSGVSDFMKVMMEEGLLDSHPVAQEIATHAKRALNSSAPAGLRKAGSVVMRALSEIYSTSDNLTKMHAVLSKFEQYKARAKREGWSDEQLLRFAAKRVSDEYPNATRVSNWVHKWQNNPLSAAFVGYNAEAVRTRLMSLRNMVDDFKAGDTNIAMRKLVGHGLLGAMLPGLAAGAKAYFGVTDDEMKVMEAGAPEYMKGHVLVPLGKKSLVDASYLQPDPQVNAINQIMRGRPLYDTGADLIKNYVGGGIPAQGFLEWWANETGTGAPVYSEKATPLERNMALVNKVLVDPLVPGTVGEVKRAKAALTGESYNGYPITPSAEAMRLTTGLTPLEIDATKKVASKIRDFGSGWNSDLGFKIRKDKTPRAQAIAEVNEKRRAAFDEIAGVIKAMRKSGVSLPKIRFDMKKLGISESEVDKFIKPYKAYRGPVKR